MLELGDTKDIVLLDMGNEKASSMSSVRRNTAFLMVVFAALSDSTVERPRLLQKLSFEGVLRYAIDPGISDELSRCEDDDRFKKVEELVRPSTGFPFFWPFP